MYRIHSIAAALAAAILVMGTISLTGLQAAYAVGDGYWAFWTDNKYQLEDVWFEVIPEEGSPQFDNMTLEYIGVEYAGRSFILNPSSISYTSTSETFSGNQTIISTLYYQKFGSGTCNAGNWNTVQDCYKFYIEFVLEDHTTGQANIKETLKMYGTKYNATDGYPTYSAHFSHEMDFHVADGSDPDLDEADLIKERNEPSCSGYATVNTEAALSNACSGQQYRVYTNDNSAYTLGIDPINTSTVSIVALDDTPGNATPTTLDGELAYDNNEDISPADLDIWVIYKKTGNSSACIPGFPCKMEGKWVENGY